MWPPVQEPLKAQRETIASDGCGVQMAEGVCCSIEWVLLHEPSILSTFIWWVSFVLL